MSIGLIGLFFGFVAMVLSSISIVQISSLTRRMDREDCIRKQLDTIINILNMSHSGRQSLNSLLTPNTNPPMVMTPNPLTRPPLLSISPVSSLPSIPSPSRENTF